VSPAGSPSQRASKCADDGSDSAESVALAFEVSLVWSADVDWHKLRPVPEEIGLEASAVLGVLGIVGADQPLDIVEGHRELTSGVDDAGGRIER